MTFTRFCADSIYKSKIQIFIKAEVTTINTAYRMEQMSSGADNIRMPSVVFSFFRISSELIGDKRFVKDRDNREGK